MRSLLPLLPLLVVAGCQQPCFMTAEDFNGHRAVDLPTVSAESVASGCGPLNYGPIATVLDPEGDRRYISLSECIALALENGRSGTTSVRVLAYNPAIMGAAIDQSLAKFDAHWQTSMTWTRLDQPAGTPVTAIVSPTSTIQAVITPITALQQDTASFNTQLLKPLPTGGLAGITFTTDYVFSNVPSTVNPAYRPKLQFVFDQPLLQGAGVEINQLLTTQPNSVGTSGNGSGAPGILLARVALDQARDTFDGQVQDLLLNLEVAYWNLYFGYWALYSRDVAVRQAHAAWQAAKTRYDLGQLRIQELALIEEQYQGFRAERITSLGVGSGALSSNIVSATGGALGPGVLDAERQLRFVIGLPPEDGHRLIPSDTPVKAAYRPDWQLAVQEALASRPELLVQRQQVKAARLTLRRVENLTLPTLNFTSSYDINGLGSHLDGGPVASNAFHSLAENEFHDWMFGLNMDVPIGFRDANAQVRAARLTLAQQIVQLRDLETQGVFALQVSYRQLIQAYELLPIQAARRKAAAIDYQSRYEEFRLGLGDVGAFLLAQSRWVDALRDEQRALFAYNIALADFERQRGTILRYNNVTIADGPLPGCVQARASEHIRQQQRALLLRERALPDHPTEYPPGMAGWASGQAPLGPAVEGDPPRLCQLVEKGSGKAGLLETAPPLEEPDPPPSGRDAAAAGPEGLGSFHLEEPDPPRPGRDAAAEFMDDYRRAYEHWKLFHPAAWQP